MSKQKFRAFLFLNKPKGKCKRHGKYIPTFPVSSNWNLFKGRIWTLGKILPAPVNQKLFGRFTSPASSTIIKISYI